MCAFRWFVNGAKGLQCRCHSSWRRSWMCDEALFSAGLHGWESQLAFPPAQRFKLMLYVPDSNINGTTPITIDSPGATVLFCPPYQALNFL
jgi:hypothetical protein